MVLGVREVLHHYEVAYYAYEGVESQTMNMKKLNEIYFNAITIVKRNDN